MKQKGIVRIEIHVRKEDAALVRGVASALADPVRSEEARTLLRQRFTELKRESLKELLAEAPLEGVDLERSRDAGRAVEL
ncbi:MAG TPA: hypothetical protein VJA26_18390 [Gammaproteobacteria bacterium]|nr:hypothetical protein [Gammaproteobacteria bacterium]